MWSAIVVENEKWLIINVIQEILSDLLRDSVSHYYELETNGERSS